MVTNQASIKRDGVQDYVSLRATAAIIFAYSVFMAWFFITTDNLTFRRMARVVLWPGYESFHIGSTSSSDDPRAHRPLAGANRLC